MGEHVSPESRMDLRPVAPQLHQAQTALHAKAIGFLDPLLVELVLLRASQLNGRAAAE